jgi:hypothetical protein
MENGNNKLCLDANIDFWKDADDFLKSQLPPEFENKLQEFVINKKYNENELRLFNFMLKESLGFYTTIFILRNLK